MKINGSKNIFRIKTVLAVGFFALAGLAFGVPVAAADTAGGAVITFQNGSGPLFNFAGFMPGDSAISWMRGQNLGTPEIDIDVWVENAVNTDKLGNAMQLTIKKDTTVLYRDSLTNFFNAGHVHLSTLGALETSTYVFALDFDPMAGNEYQGTAISFDLAVNTGENGNGVIGDDTTGDDTTGDDGTGDDVTSDDAGDDTTGDDTADDDTPVIRHSSGTIGGGSAVPALIITNVRAEGLTDRSAFIKWDTNLDATSQVIYSPSSDNHSFDPAASPLYGYSVVYPAQEGRDLAINHVVPLSGLNVCQTYYYRVVSRALIPLPSISEEHTFKTTCSLTGGGSVSNSGSAGLPAGNGSNGSNGEVLGAQTEDSVNNGNGSPEKSGSAAADKNKALSPLVPGGLLDTLSGILGITECLPDFPWWLFLVFAVYPIIKNRQRFNDAKRTIDLTLQKFFQASGRAWLYSSLLPIGLAVWAYFARRCLPWWPLVVLFIATIVGHVYDRRQAAQAISRSGVRNTQSIDSSPTNEKPSATL